MSVSSRVMSRPRVRILALGLACLALQQVAAPYHLSLLGIEAPSASLMHLHAGALLLIAMLERDRRVIVGVAAILLIGWLVRAGWQDYNWQQMVSGVGGALLALGWLFLCVRWLSWPPATGKQRVELAELPRFALIGLLLYPAGLVVILVLTNAPYASLAEQLSSAVQMLLAKHFGVLVLTFPLLLGWTDRHETPRLVRRIGWRVPLLLGTCVLLSIVVMRLTHDALGGTGNGSIVLMDYRFGLFAVLAWCVMRLRPRLSMPLLAATLFLLVVGITGTAEHAGKAIGFVNLVYLAVELAILLMAMLYVRLVGRDWRELKARLEAETRRDPMTGLPNLKALREQLLGAPTPADGKDLGYLLLDHSDDLIPGYGLQMQASVMNEVAGQLDPMVRPYLVGTGQFALLPRAVDHQCRDFWPQLVERIEQTEIGVAGERFRLMPYMGVTRYSDTTRVAVDDALLRVSQLAFEARGRNEMTPLYESQLPDGEQRPQRRQFDAAGLALDCLRSGRIDLYLQPIRSMDAALHAAQAQDSLVGEILCRLRDVDGAIITPERFLKALEAMGRGAELDLAVIRTLFRELKAHPEAAKRCRRLSINVTGQSLVSASFAAQLRELLKQAPVPLSVLCFEITESATIATPFAARQLLDELRSHGSLIAIDDFGTGMQSFSRLKEMPIDIIKIDGSFVLNVAERGRDYALVEACVAVARAFNAETVAEFVETEEVADILRELGVGWMQGYLHSRPLPLADVLNASTT